MYSIKTMMKENEKKNSIYFYLIVIWYTFIHLTKYQLKLFSNSKTYRCFQKYKNNLMLPSIEERVTNSVI